MYTFIFTCVMCAYVFMIFMYISSFILKWHVLSEELALRHRERTRLSRLAIEILGVLEGRVVDYALRASRLHSFAVYNHKIVSDNG